MPKIVCWKLPIKESFAPAQGNFFNINMYELCTAVDDEALLFMTRPFLSLFVERVSLDVAVKRLNDR